MNMKIPASCHACQMEAETEDEAGSIRRMCMLKGYDTSNYFNTRHPYCILDLFRCASSMTHPDKEGERNRI